MPEADRSRKAGGSYLIVDLGGTKTAVAVGFDDATVVDRTEFATSDPEPTLSRIFSLARPLIDAYAPAAVGISCGGPLNSAKGLVLGPPNMTPGWQHVPIVERFVDTLGLPTYLEHDANAGALAEWIYGAARGFETVIFLTCGTGLGAGLIIDGGLFRGKQNLAGEVGHIRLERDGPMGFGKPGSLEGFSSGGGLPQTARRLLAEPHGPSQLDHWNADDLTGRHIGEAAIEGDALARAVIEVAGTYLGRGIAILIDTLNPECIVLGSMAVRLGKLLTDPMWREIKAEALETAWRNCTIVPAALGERIGDIAALCAARYGIEEKKRETTDGVGE